MKIVHGFNEKREIVKKELHTSKEKGAFLKWNNEEVIIEPDLKVWNKIYKPNDKSEGFKNAFYVITNDCNKHCDYCYNRDLLCYHPGGDSINQLIKNLEMFVPSERKNIIPFKEHELDGIHPTISYIGGEPTVADTIIPFTRYITETRNNKIFIYTNGIKLLDIDYLKQFPNTNQIIFAISTDINTTEDFIRKVTKNIMKFNFEYGYSIVVSPNKEEQIKNFEIDKICRSYQPQEIRYRVYINQPKGYSDYLSSVMKFIEKSRDISYDYYLDNAWLAHGGFVSTLKYDKTENPDTGNIAIASLPVWRKSFTEILCKWGAFVMNTNYINIPGECHMNSADLFFWRMKHTKEYVTEETKHIWGTKNPYFEGN